MDGECTEERLMLTTSRNSDRRLNAAETLFSRPPASISRPTIILRRPKHAIGPKK